MKADRFSRVLAALLKYIKYQIRREIGIKTEGGRVKSQHYINMVTIAVLATSR